jgi:thioredoxin
VGALILDAKQPILLITPSGKEAETIMRLARVGYDNTLGYLKGGFEAWKSAGLEYDTIPSVTAKVLEEKIATKAAVFDVRKPGEYDAEHIVDVPSTPLDFLNEHLAEFPKEEPFYLHCAGGYRSMIAASIVKARGYHNVINVLGGFDAIKKTGIKTTNYVCPSTLKNKELAIMSNFYSIIKSEKPVLVDFFATWCGPCQTLAPILKQVKDSLGDRITIVKIDVDKNQQMAAQYQVRGVPTMILFQAGRQLWRQSGVVSKEEIIKTIFEKSN